MAKKELITEEKVINTPAGGVLIGKDKQGQTIIPNDGSLGGFLIGRLHKDGGIKAINKSNGQPLEMQANEVVITAPAVADQTKREFEGEMLTNREILSKINQRGGGVSLEDGGALPSEVCYNGSSYNYGGRTMTDYEIIQEINSCGCEHSDYEIGGVFHGSPYSFDKFKTETMGTGSGKQIDGWGIYLTDSKDSAKIYGRNIYETTLFKGKDFEEYTFIDLGNEPVKKDIVKNVVKALYEKYNKKFDINKFNLYYDYSKDKSLQKVNFNDYELVEFDYNGFLFYKTLSRLLKGDKEASLFLLNNGVDGLRRKISNTRTDYIIFNADDITIKNIEKFKKGGHLAEGLSLRDIADIHNISIAELKKQVRDGLKAESEHTSNKREQMKIVKDHLLENPKYYTLLEKAGLAKGGLIAPNGNKSNLTAEQYKLVRTPEFKEWFGDWEKDPKNASKVVDDNGEPLVVYHTTNDDFYVFDKKKSKQGFFFSANKERLKAYGKNKLLSVFLNIKNPSQNEFNTKGFDGVMDFGQSKSRDVSSLYEIIAFQSNQIKLADGTNTTFDLNSNDIRYDKGGSLVKDAKSGNTPARDLNNYNDVLDLEADGMVGADSGLAFAYGGDIYFETDGTGGADASAGVGAFEDGGEVDEYAEGGEVTNPMVSNWDNINSSWKDTSKVKKIVWANNPYDKGLYSIVAPYLGNDKFRPVMSGINFDENGITATNAHVLITLPYPNKKYEGIYEPDLSKRKDSDQITIDGKYPNYSAVIPFSDNTTHFLIDVYKLLQYTNVAMKYANKTTYQIAYKLNNEAVGYNGRFMVENLKTLLKLGHEKVYAHYIAPNKAMVLSPSKNYRVGNDEILLTMPVMLMNEKLGARDIDYGRELSVYFDFDDNEIHNADGSVAEFKMKYENNAPVDKDDVKLLESMVKKNKSLSILDYVLVKDNTIRATNLYSEYVIKNVNLADGIYLPSNGNLEITMNPIDDFPRNPIFVSDEDTIEFVIPSTVFEYYIDRFKFVLDQDDLRPIFKGISLKHTSNNKLFLLGTDSKLGLKIDITKYVDIPLYNREIQTVIDPVWLFGFLNKLEEGALHIKSNKVATIIDSESKSFYCRNVDGNYPNLEAVIPQESEDLISIEYSALKKCLNNEFMKNYKRHTDKYEIIGVFDKNGELFVGRRTKNLPNAEFKDIEKLCDVTFESSKEEYRYDGQSVLLAMPLIAEVQDNFAFDEELLSKVMTIVNDSVIQMHHNGTKRAFLIPIHSFEYEKTTIEHKTREQKPTLEQEQMIAEVEEIDEIKEAIEVMQMLLETAPKKDKKEIVEAIEVMEMLLESYQN